MSKLFLMAAAIACLALGLPEPAGALDGPKNPPKSARVALVGNGAAVRNVLDLALVKLTPAKSIELLDRTATERMLAEQKLTLAGLINADTAIQAGKILGVDLFGVVETGPADKGAVGVVIYDAITGVKLSDRTLADGGPDKDALTLADSVRAAVGKWAAGSSKLKTVCFLAVRNADLPPEMNAFCQSLAAILERQLVNSSALAVLERKRLEFVNQEKNLTPAIKNLLASVVTVELQMSRSAKGNGLTVLAFLTDHQGKQIAKLTVHSKETSIPQLLGPLVEQINQTLAVAGSADGGDPLREGERFAREAEHLLSHKHYLPALQAAEAAFALAPAKTHHSALLSECLIIMGQHVANPKGMNAMYGGRIVVKVETDALKTMLRLARRGFEIRTNALVNLQPRTLVSVGNDQALHARGAFAQRISRNQLGFFDPKAFDEEAVELRRELLAAIHRLLVTEVDAWADVAHNDPAAFYRYHQNLLMRFATMHEQAAGSKEFTAMIDHAVRRWLEISQGAALGPLQPASLVWFMNDLERYTLLGGPVPWKLTGADQDKLLALFKTMAGHRHPLIALGGRHAHLEMSLRAKRIEPAEAAKEFQAIVQTVKSMIEKPPPGFSADYHVSCYKFLLNAIGNSTMHRAKESTRAELFALCEFMIAREEIVSEVIQHALAEGSFSKDSKRRFDLINRTLALIDSPRCRFIQVNVQASVENQLLVAWEETVRRAPELRPKTPLPWDRVRTVLDITKIEGATRIYAVKIVGDHAYAVTGGFAGERKPVLQVVRVGLAEGTPQVLGKTPVRLRSIHPDGRLGDGNFLDYVTGLVVAKDVVYVGTASDGIYAFPRNGTPARRIGTKQGLPADGITALAMLDDKLYVGLTNGYFVAFDPIKEHCTVLASSQRKEKLSPFDDGDAFSIPYLVADPPRQRVLFVLYQGIANAKDNEKDGLWEYNTKTNAFTSRLKLWRHASLGEGSDVHANRIVISGFVANHVIAFDLERNKASLLSRHYLIGPELRITDPQKRREPFDAFPYLCQDGWVWTARPFGRKSLDGGKREIFPSLAADKDVRAGTFTPQWMQRIDAGSALLIGDAATLWVVHLRQEKSGKGAGDSR